MKTKFVVLFTIIFVFEYGFAATSSGSVGGGSDTGHSGGSNGGYEQTPCSAFFEYYWKARIWGIDVAERSNGGFYNGQPASWAIRSVVSQWQLEGLVNKNFDTGIIQFILDNFGIYPASIGFVLMQTGLTFPEFQETLNLLPDKNWTRFLSVPEVEVILARAVEILAAKNEVPSLLESESLYLDPKQQNLSAAIQFKRLLGLGSKISGVFGVNGDFLNIEGGLLLQYWENSQYKTIPMYTLSDGSLGIEHTNFDLATTQFAVGSVSNSALIYHATEYSVKISFYGEVEWYGKRRVVSQTVPVTYRPLSYAVVEVNGNELSVTSSVDAVVIGGSFTVDINQATDRIIDAEISVNGESYNIAARLVWKQKGQAMYIFNFGRIPALYPGQEAVVKIVNPECSNPYLDIQSLSEKRLDVQHIYVGNASGGGGGNH